MGSCVIHLAILTVRLATPQTTVLQCNEQISAVDRHAVDVKGDEVSSALDQFVDELSYSSSKIDHFIWLTNVNHILRSTIID